MYSPSVTRHVNGIVRLSGSDVNESGAPFQVITKLPLLTGRLVSTTLIFPSASLYLKFGLSTWISNFERSYALVSVSPVVKSNVLIVSHNSGTAMDDAEPAKVNSSDLSCA
ncbi:hypothetical protein D3C75_786370 [compost metagenome]